MRGALRTFDVEKRPAACVRQSVTVLGGQPTSAARDQTQVRHAKGKTLSRPLDALARSAGAKLE